MKKFPSSVTILGRKFKVKQLTNMSYQGQPCLGLCDYNKETLFIEKAQSLKSKRATLIHECCHAMLIISGIDQKLSEGENEIYAQLFTAFCEDMGKVL